MQLPDPELQINFAAALAEIRHLYLQDALSETVRGLNISEEGRRILSAYPIDKTKPCKDHGDNTLWIITGAIAA